MAGFKRWILPLACIVVIVSCFVEFTNANDQILQGEEEYYEEDEYLEDVKDRWSLEPLVLLKQYTVRTRRDAIRNGDLAAVQAEAEVELETEHKHRVVRSATRSSRRSKKNRSKKSRRKASKKNQRKNSKKNKRRNSKKNRRRNSKKNRKKKSKRRRLTKEERARRKEKRRERKRLRKQKEKEEANERKQDEAKNPNHARQSLQEAITAGDEAVLERMLNMDLDLEINMNKICSELETHTTKKITCSSNANDNKYRRMDGSCNNIGSPDTGRALQPLVRWLPAEYIAIKRGNYLPRNLTSPRIASSSVVELDDGRADLAQSDVTILNMHWGQFTDHDITHTPASQVTCDCKSLNSDCYPIQIPDDDPVFSGQCFEVPRSKAHCDDPEARQQFNEITSFIDASQVYGSTETEARHLRYFTKEGYTAANTGRLRMQENPNRNQASPKRALLPHQGLGECFGESKRDEVVCGEAGDFRANEQPGLTSLHTIFARLHNDVAAELIHVNPHWKGQSSLVFDEARKIVGAIMQSIDFNEYLPTILGPTEYDRWIGQYNGYDTNTNPMISNVFATAAYRQGHSAVDTVLQRYLNSPIGETKLDDLPLDKAFFNAFFMYDFENGGIDGFVEGMVRQPARKIDRFFVKPLHERLFVSPDDDGDETGLDIVSLNVLRGRDNGIPPYAKWREWCGMSCTSWQDLDSVMSSDTIDKLKVAYGASKEGVRHIDPFLGFVSEEPVAGGTLGPTLSCIIGKQFKNLRDGDRFYYENREGDQAFDSAQIDAIRRISLASVFCETLDNPVGFQKNVFRVSNDETNPYSLCDDPNGIPELDLTPWCEPVDEDDRRCDVLSRDENLVIAAAKSFKEDQF